MAPAKRIIFANTNRIESFKRNCWIVWMYKFSFLMIMWRLRFCFSKKYIDIKDEGNHSALAKILISLFANILLNIHMNIHFLCTWSIYGECSLGRMLWVKNQFEVVPVGAWRRISLQLGSVALLQRGVLT